MSDSEAAYQSYYSTPHALCSSESQYFRLQANSMVANIGILFKLSVLLECELLESEWLKVIRV